MGLLDKVASSADIFTCYHPSSSSALVKLGGWGKNWNQCHQYIILTGWTLSQCTAVGWVGCRQKIVFTQLPTHTITTTEIEGRSLLNQTELAELAGRNGAKSIGRQSNTKPAPASQASGSKMVISMALSNFSYRRTIAQ